VIAQSVKLQAAGWTIGVLGLDSLRGLGIFLFTIGKNNFWFFVRETEWYQFLALWKAEGVIIFWCFGKQTE
jgi:hypothetical protein